MKKAKTNKSKRKTPTYERDGYKFAFDDEQLQKRYISIFEGFKKVFPDLPEQKVISWADARGMVFGSTYEKLNDAEDIYDSKTNSTNARTDKHHKLVLFDNEIGGTTVNNWVKNFEKLKADIIKTGGGSFDAGTVRFNFVYYDRGYGD